MIVHAHSIQIAVVEKKGTVVNDGKKTTAIVLFAGIGFFYHMISPPCEMGMSIPV